MMLDARFLVDVHFRQGGKSKDTFPPAAEANTNESAKHDAKFPAGDWHKEQEQIGAGA